MNSPLYNDLRIGEMLAGLGSMGQGENDILKALAGAGGTPTPSFGFQEPDEYAQADALRGQQFGAKAPQMDGMTLPAALGGIIASLFGAGNEFMGGFQGAQQQNNQRRMQDWQLQQQRLGGKADLLERKGDRKARLGAAEAERAYKLGRDQVQDKQWGDEFLYRQKKDKEANDLKRTIEEERQKTARQRITNSLVNAKNPQLSKWIGVMGDENQTPEMKAVAFASLQRLRPDVYGEMSPDEVEKAIKASPWIVKLQQERALTEQKKRQDMDSIITRRAQQNKLDAQRTALLREETKHYTKEVLDKAADLHSRIWYRRQMAEQGNKRIGIAEQNMWNMTQSREVDDTRLGKGQLISQYKQMADIEMDNIKAIVKRNDGEVPDEDSDDYEAYQISQQRYTDARNMLQEVSGRPTKPPSVIDIAVGPEMGKIARGESIEITLPGPNGTATKVKGPALSGPIGRGAPKPAAKSGVKQTRSGNKFRVSGQ
jgi:hypothetical protein